MHRHFFRVVARRHTIWYKFECQDCGVNVWTLKHVFWKGVTCPHGYSAGEHHFESRYCHAYPTAATTYDFPPR